MSEREFRLKDYVKVKRDESIASMDEVQITMFKDSIASQGKKGLVVTFDLSHSGRKINNRIYPAWGQRDGADSWTMPFGRPIIVDHVNHAKNTIGRFIDVQWQSLEEEAIAYLGDVAAYIDVKRALDSNEPTRIYKTYNKYGLFKDKQWPGVGKLVAKALITDKDAIERFLDGRFLTFSAGSRTNAYTCLACGSHWHDGDICDHRPGIADEDGNIAYFMTGLFLGDEGSVVNSPADDFSQVRALEFQDFKVDFEDTDWAMLESEDTFMFTDSKVEVASMKLELVDLMELEPETLVNKIVDGSFEFPFTDLTGKTHTEIQWLIRIHDSLHARYDSVVRGEYGETIDTLPTDIFKLHGAIHVVSMDKDFRDSLINGDLDHYDDAGTPSDLYVAKRTKSNDSDATDQLKQLKDEIMGVLKTALENKSEDPKVVAEVKDEHSKPTSTEPVQDNTGSDGKQEDQKEEASQEEEVLEPSLEDKLRALLASDKTPEDLVSELRDLVVENAEEGPEFVDDDTIDWFLLDTALEAMVGEDAISDEQRKKLPDSSFCGPSRSFPIADSNYETAARALIQRARLSDEQKTALLACLDRKAKLVGAECSCENCGCKKYGDLRDDYAEALKTVDTLKTQLEGALEAHATALEVEISDAEGAVRLDSLLTWFGNMGSEEQNTDDSDVNPLEHIQPVENPGVSSSQDAEPKKKLNSLGSFEQKILTKYKTIRDESGQDAADNWFALQQSRGYLPRSLDLTEYIN